MKMWKHRSGQSKVGLSTTGEGTILFWSFQFSLLLLFDSKPAKRLSKPKAASIRNMRESDCLKHIFFSSNIAIKQTRTWRRRPSCWLSHIDKYTGQTSLLGRQSRRIPEFFSFPLSCSHSSSSGCFLPTTGHKYNNPFDHFSKDQLAPWNSDKPEISRVARSHISWWTWLTRWYKSLVGANTVNEFFFFFFWNAGETLNNLFLSIHSHGAYHH